MQKDYELIIVGAGHAGYSLAREVRKLSPHISIMLLCNDSGDYYSKPLLSNGFSKQKTAADLVQKSAALIAEELQISIVPHCQVQQLDRQQRHVLSTKGSFSYQQLVLATGAEPIQLDLPDACNGLVFSVNDLQQYQQFQETSNGKHRITVLGSGLVGIEYANDLANAGFQVQLVALDALPLQQLLPAELGQLLQQKLQQLGVEFYLSTSIKAAERSGSGLQLQLQNGQPLYTDLLLSAVGLKPRVTLAQQSGLVCGKGIVVNAQLQTSDPAIYALGDCAEVHGALYMYIQPISLAAKALAKTLTGQSTNWQLPVIPVIVKSPALPVVSWPPAKNETGQWQLTGSGDDWQALFLTADQQLKGFALTGKMVSQRLRLAKELPPLIA